MANIRNVVVSNYIGDGVSYAFYAAGLIAADYNLCIVSLVGRVLEAQIDYTIDASSLHVKLTTAASPGATVVIYVFEKTTKKIAVTDADNVTTITRTVFVTDGSTLNYSLRGDKQSNNNCIVVVSGLIKQAVADYDINNRTITFTAAPPRGLVVQVLAITSSLSNKILGGISPSDEVTLITRTTATADGINDTYTVQGGTNNKSLYTLAFINGRMQEGGIDYIVSHNRVKFNRKPAAGAILHFVVYGAPTPTTTPPKMERVRYLNKQSNLNERTLYRRWWREQISHYGLVVNYYRSLTTIGNADIIYGESPLAGYSEPEEMNIALKVDGETSMFSKFGLMSDTDATCVIHYDDFEEIFGKETEPHVGDLIEFTEVGIDRLNYPKRGPRMMEITLIDDEIQNETNNLASHYVWYIKLKRFDYSRENSILPELGTKSAEYTGETVEGVVNPIEEMSKKIFDYNANNCSNDNVYGDY